MFNIAKKLGWETFWDPDSVKFTWDSTFVDALGPRDAIKIKPKSNTGKEQRRIISEIYMFIFQSKFNNPLYRDRITEKKCDFPKKSMGLPNFKGRKSGLPEFES